MSNYNIMHTADAQLQQQQHQQQQHQMQLQQQLNHHQMQQQQQQQQQQNFRTKVETYSPKSSPRGGRSPIVARQDSSSGTLKTTISLGKNPSIVHSGPFYLMKEQPGACDLTGAANLMACYGLDHSYSKFSGKKVKEQLSAFLPNLPGVIDGPGQADNSSLRSIIEKQPILGKELLPLTSLQLAGFRLHPGPLPEQYRYLNTAPARRHKNKHKKHRHRDGQLPPESASPGADPNGADTHEKKHKKQKRHEDDKERKKRKKEKKRKKQRHSPEHPGSVGCNTGGGTPSSSGAMSVGLPMHSPMF